MRTELARAKRDWEEAQQTRIAAENGSTAVQRQLRTLSSANRNLHRQVEELETQLQNSEAELRVLRSRSQAFSPTRCT